MATTTVNDFLLGLEGPITDWEVYSFRQARPFRGTLHDEYGKKHYFEVIAVNRAGQDIGRGWSASEAYQDVQRRRT